MDKDPPIVTFFADGAINKVVEVPPGGKATPPTDIAPKTGYDLDGWYTTADYAAKWDFNSSVTADIGLYDRWKPLTFAAAIAYMAETASSASSSYTLPSGSEPYTCTVTLTTANSPASVTIDGGGRVRYSECEPHHNRVGRYADAEEHHIQDAAAQRGGGRWP